MAAFILSVVAVISGFPKAEKNPFRLSSELFYMLVLMCVYSRTIFLIITDAMKYIKMED